MIKRKICFVITARPSYSRIRTVLQSVKNNKNLKLQIVLAASASLSNYGNIAEVINKDGFKIDSIVTNAITGESLMSMAKTTGLGIIELSTVFENLKPHAVVTIADRFETISTAIASSYLNIPLVHVQGGEVTGSIDEKVRHSITKLADIHFVATKGAAERIKRLGESKKSIFVTGCPSIDIAKIVSDTYAKKIDIKNIKGVGNAKNFDEKNGYILVLQHPVTTSHNAAASQIQKTLNVVRKLNEQVFWFWPNIDAGSDKISNTLRKFREKKSKTSKFHFVKNLPSEEFLSLLIRSKVIVGNSSVAIRECSFLGVPAVNIGDRQQGRERGKNVIDVEYDEKSIENAIKFQINKKRYKKEYLYGKGNTDETISKLLENIELNYQKIITY